MVYKFRENMLNIKLFCVETNLEIFTYYFFIIIILFFITSKAIVISIVLD